MTEEEIAALKAKNAQLEADKIALVGETTELRKSRADKETELQLAKEALVAAAEKNNQNPEEAKIAEVVTKVLSQEKLGQAERNKKAAFDKFVAENKEYHPDNDPGGIKAKALETQFNRFNLNGLVEVDDFMKVIGDSNNLLRGIDTPRQPSTQVPSSPHSVVAPSSQQVSELSPAEQALIERNGMTQEKYLALKAKMPDFAAALLATIR